jgi:hypothetical protein
MLRAQNTLFHSPALPSPQYYSVTVNPLILSLPTPLGYWNHQVRHVFPRKIGEAKDLRIKV